MRISWHTPCISALFALGAIFALANYSLQTHVAFMPDLAEPSAQLPAKIYPFADVEFARNAAKRSVEARRARAEQAAQLKPTQNPFDPTVSEVKQALDFADRRLLRVREQLEKLDALAAGEKDTKRLKELADATTRLSEQERILAGRPLPGSRRPSSDKQERRRILDLAPVGIAGQILDVAQVTPAPSARPYAGEYDDPPDLVRAPEIKPPTAPQTA